MPMHATTIARKLCVLSILAVGAYALPASARTISAIAGLSPIPADDGWFNRPGGFVYNTSTSNKQWMIPIVFDNIGARTINVRGMSTASGTLSCQAFAYGIDGLTASSSPPTVFPRTGLYTTIALGLTV